MTPLVLHHWTHRMNVPGIEERGLLISMARSFLKRVYACPIGWLDFYQGNTKGEKGWEYIDMVRYDIDATDQPWVRIGALGTYALYQDVPVSRLLCRHTWETRLGMHMPTILRFPSSERQ